MAEEDQGRKLAQRFLRTAVVVDDKAEMALDPVPKEISTPDRRTRSRSPEDRGDHAHGSQHTLDAKSVIGSFSAQGVICGVIEPVHSAVEVVRRADIVVLDWLLRDNKPDYTLELLGDLVGGENDRNALRLVAIYTGEARLDEIAQSVLDELRSKGLDPEEDHLPNAIPYRHGRIVLYAKSSVNLVPSLKERGVAAEDLPKRLLGDFAAMTEGLLPSIALTSLAAVREGEHEVLDQFRAELDPAFLAHRTCLPEPEDAEGQMVNHVAEELRGLMDNAVAAASPAGGSAVERWLRRKFHTDAQFSVGKQKLDLEETIRLANIGIDSSRFKNATTKKKIEVVKSLSKGIFGGDAEGLDEQLAWVMSFRTVRSAPPPTLWLGAVVAQNSDSEEQLLLCMRPRCDCVRLNDETSFLFLPLSAPQKGRQQIVVRRRNQFERLAIDLKPNSWVFRRFCPSAGAGSVIASRQGDDGDFSFTDTCKSRYEWLGELKAEYAQRIAQTLARDISRVAVDESEWLRRIVEMGD